MFLSYNWLKEYIDIDMPLVELDDMLTMLGIEVDSVIDYKKKYHNFFVAHVMECEKHPEADKLSICQVDFGSGQNQVICGAANIAKGQKVALAIPGAVVPNGGFEIGSRKLRGVLSEGMICSVDELDLGGDASGIWVLPEEAEKGTPLADYLNMNDIVLELSITPNRPDWLSHVGVARDIAAYLKKEYKKPEIKVNEEGGNVHDSVKITIEDKEKCPRYTARVVRGIKVGESPDWLQQKIIKAGMRPLNVIVDVTNYVMLECGQPLHAFDLNKLKNNEIIIKTAAKGEKFTTLDSKERELDEQMLMICDGERSIAIGGVMGGENSEIDDNSTDILIESAFFNASSVRRTSKKLSIQSESSYRFERGVDLDNVDWACNRAAQLIAELTGGKVEKEIYDEYPNKIEKTKVELRYDRVRQILGFEITNDEIKSMMLGLQMSILEEKEGLLLLEVPYFRVDIALEIDLIEEIARLSNFSQIEPDYTSNINFNSQPIPEKLSIPALRNQLRDFFINSGVHEILTQNQLDPQSAAIFAEKTVKIANPLGEELSIMRPSLIPAMLRTVERNIRMGNHDLRLFEIGRTFHAEDENPEHFIPGIRENQEFLLAIAGKREMPNWASNGDDSSFYDIKGIYENWRRFFRFENLKLKELKEKNVAFSKNALAIMNKKQVIGVIGEIDKKLLKKFDVEVPVYMMHFDLSALYKLERTQAKYKKVSPFPASSRDLAFLVDKDVKAGDMENEIQNKGGKLLKSVELFDVYQGKNISDDKKSIAFALKFAADDKTLRDQEVDQAVGKIIKAIEKKFKAELRS